MYNIVTPIPCPVDRDYLMTKLLNKPGEKFVKVHVLYPIVLKIYSESALDISEKTWTNVTPQKVAEPQSKIQPIFNQWGVFRPLFFTDYSSRMFISQFPANKITEIDFEMCEKAKFRAPFCGC